MNFGQVVSELKRERALLDRAIAALEEVSGRRPLGAEISRTISTRQTLGKRRGLSPAGRKRISDAMKKRWSEHRAKLASVRKSPKAA